MKIEPITIEPNETPDDPQGMVWYAYARSESPFRPHGIALNHDAAQRVAIVDVRTNGIHSQLLNSKPLPGAAFSENVRPPFPFPMDTCLELQLSLVNLTREPVHLSGHIVGDVRDRTTASDGHVQGAGPLGLYFKDAEPGRTVEVITRPQVTMRVKNIYVPPLCAKDFHVSAVIAAGRWTSDFRCPVRRVRYASSCGTRATHEPSFEAPSWVGSNEGHAFREGRWPNESPDRAPAHRARTDRASDVRPSRRGSRS